MDKDFLTNFLKVSDEVVRQSKTTSWPIPEGVDKTKGELGLLPEDSVIEAWQVPTSSAMLLRFFVLAQKAKTILELGTSIGFSTIWLALGAKETEGHVYTTEILPEKADIAKQNFEKSQVSKYITLLEQDILKVLQNWNREQKIDFVFMDADKQRYGQYLDEMYPLLSENALIVVDNVGNYRQHMTDFLSKCTELENSVVHFLDIDNGLLLILKNGGANLSSITDIYKPNKI